MKVRLGWLLVIVCALVVGWRSPALRLWEESPWTSLVRARSLQARRMVEAYQKDPSRPRLAACVRALLNERDALSVARYPHGNDPHRYEVVPEVVQLLNELSELSETNEERQEWRLLFTQAYNPPPE